MTFVTYIILWLGVAIGAGGLIKYGANGVPFPVQHFLGPLGPLVVALSFWDGFFEGENLSNNATLR